MILVALENDVTTFAWKNNEIKWMLELKVALSIRWRKRVDFPYLEIFQILLQK